MSVNAAGKRRESTQRRSWRRVAIFTILGYLALSLMGNALLWLGVAAGRLLDHDPRVRDESLPAIKHLRKVDERLWAGAQPTKQHYRELSELGVSVVVDVRTDSASDPREDDPDFLRSLGMEYEWLPVHDGHAPDPRTVKRFVEIVNDASGIVFMHCGGGVGRSGSLTAAYQAAEGENPSLLEMMAIGPMSLEQAWFIGAVGEDDPSPTNVMVQGFSRYVVDAPRALLHRALP